MPENASGVRAGRGARAVRVGTVVIMAAVVLSLAVFLIGQENNLFSRKNHYYVDLQSVSGIRPGNPVELDGVSVGAVERVILPRNPKRKFIRVWMKIDRRYGHRVRADSQVKIRTLGLLGDKYLELNSGDPNLAEVPDEGQVTPAPSTGVDQLIASGTDVMDNVSAISFQLKNILGRVDKGEGLLGELTSDSEASRKLQAQVFATLDTIQRVANKMDTGEGPFPRLLNDRALADRLAQSVDSLHGVLASVEHGPGLVPALLSDPTTRTQYDATIAALQKVAQDLQKFSGNLNSGRGLVPRLVNDEAYGRQVTGEIRQIVDRLNDVSDKLSNGGGTVPKLINDPHVYDSVNDILVGVNDSWMLRWLIRNRQKAGIKHRYKDAIRDERKEEGEDRNAAPRTYIDGETPPPAPAPPQSTEPNPQGTEPPPGFRP